MKSKTSVNGKTTEISINCEPLGDDLLRSREAIETDMKGAKEIFVDLNSITDIKIQKYKLIQCPRSTSDTYKLFDVNDFTGINEIERKLKSAHSPAHQISEYMKLINSVNDGGNTPLMDLLIIPPASVDYDNADSTNTIDTTACSVIQTATTTTESVAVPTVDTTIDASLAENSVDQQKLSKAKKLVPYCILNHLNKNNRTALQLLKDWEEMEKILKPEDIKLRYIF